MSLENRNRFPSVQEDDDGELVIQAGRVSSSAASGDPVPPSVCLYEEDEPHRGTEEPKPWASALGGGPSCEGEGACESDDSPTAPLRNRRAAFEQNRLVTTEDDLREQVPFSGMRRAILVFAALAIAAAVVYCNFAA